jgi:polyribonucleotide nucleotidyltransferase
MIKNLNLEIGGRNLSLDIGRVAKQADGSVLVRYGDTIVLATACVKGEKRENQDFLPFIVDYRERTYAAGRIPGGWFKREGRPRDKEILTARLIDRPMRPLFPEGFAHETQIVVTVLSSDKENDSDILGLIGGSVATILSSIPFAGPIGAVRIGLIDGELVVNPTFSQLEGSQLNLVIAGTKERVTTLEGKGMEVGEDVVFNAIEKGHEVIRSIVELQERLLDEGSKKKIQVEKTPLPDGLEDAVTLLSQNPIVEVNRIRSKIERGEALEKVFNTAWESLKENYPQEDPDQLKKWIYQTHQNLMGKEIRKSILEDEIRPDGRTLHQIRPISCEVGILPRAHGSALFTRGETQSLSTVTLGTTTDEQRLEELEGESKKTFMLHYNFPPYSVGEVQFIRAPGRREIGHGALAEKALEPVIPSEDAFPYTVRIVSDILESNGSSSMATVCGGSLSLMDAGVPIKSAVAGLSIGLIQEGDKNMLLSDIAGAEDHDGDMDFKVAGAKGGLTAVQLDTKVEGISLSLVREAFELGLEGRNHILEVMNEAIEKPRTNISVYAPRVIAIDVPKEKIGEIIGPGGKMIRFIIEQTGADIEVEDDGRVTIVSSDQEGGEKALAFLQRILEEVEVGKIYNGVVKRITNFGAFVEVLPGKEGLVHISQLAPRRVERVEDVLKEGEEIQVKCIGIDSEGRIDLSRKVLLGGEEGEGGDRSDRGGRPRRSGQRSSSGGRRR